MSSETWTIGWCCEAAKGTQAHFREDEFGVFLYRESETSAPIWVMDIYGGDGDLPINYCPYCGTKLEIPEDVQHDIEMNQAVEDGFNEEQRLEKDRSEKKWEELQEAFPDWERMVTNELAKRKLK